MTRCVTSAGQCAGQGWAGGGGTGSSSNIWQSHSVGTQDLPRQELHPHTSDGGGDDGDGDYGDGDGEDDGEGDQ